MIFILAFNFMFIYNTPRRSVGRVVMQQIANLWPEFSVHRFESYTLRHKFNPTFVGFNFCRGRWTRTVKVRYGVDLGSIAPPNRHEWRGVSPPAARAGESSPFAPAINSTHHPVGLIFVAFTTINKSLSHKNVLRFCHSVAWPRNPGYAHKMRTNNKDFHYLGPGVKHRDDRIFLQKFCFYFLR